MKILEQAHKMSADFIASQSAEDQATINQAIAEIMVSDVGANALGEGDMAPDFALPNARGGTTRLSELLEQGAVVLSFYRGGWCPFCNLEFKALNDVTYEIKQLGATLVGISPELPDNSMSTAEQHQLQFEVLSDVGNSVAREWGIIMDVPAVLRPLYLKWGFDIPACNGDDTWELPIPATYVIGRDGRIKLAYVNKNYTERLHPSEILSALHATSAAA